jgi:hypothetical protein
MTSKWHPHDSFMAEIGHGLIRERFGLSPQRLHNWRVRGVPSTHRPALAVLAALHSKPIPDGFLDPPVEQAAA